MRIQTTRAVKKGESLTTCYWLTDVDQPTHIRQENILRMGHFLCECARCKDPTELGTYMSGIACTVCRGYSGIVCTICQGSNALGYVLPEDPLNLRPDAMWKCNCCETLVLAKDCLSLDNAFANIIVVMFTNFGEKPHDDSFIDFCRIFIHDASTITHHPNHWAIQRAIGVLGIYLRNHRRTTMGLELSEWYIKCLRHLLSILDILTPGLTYSRANMQLHLGAALQGQCEALKSQRKYDQVQRNSVESMVLMRKSLKFFKHEFPTAEGEDNIAQIIFSGDNSRLDRWMESRFSNLNLNN